MKSRNTRKNTGKEYDKSFRMFCYENVSFHYQLIHEKRKTISITVFPTGTITVKAPLQAAEIRINDFLQRKFRWVLQKKRYFAQFRVQPEKQYVSGETFLYRGRSYKLLVRKICQNEHVSLQHGTLTVFSARPEQKAHNQKLLEHWYLQRAHRVFFERLKVCLALFEYEQKPGLMIRQMKRRWGSYSQKTNRVTLNKELIKAATRHIDYVIVHELCHMTHKKHNRDFYDLLASRLPQWQRLKTELELSLLG